MNTPKIIRNISGTILILICLILITFFGITSLLKFSFCPVLNDIDSNIYSKGSLAFLRETEIDNLNIGDTIIYYNGNTPIGAKVVTNDKNSATIYVSSANNDIVGIPYMKISGKGAPFSVPWLGIYANWLVNGAGLNVSVATMCILFVIFATSDIVTRDE